MTPMRTILFVPAHRENMVNKAREIAADVICLDLEDAVPPAEKPRARETVRDSIKSLKAAGKRVHVRVNHLDTGWTKDDLEATVGEGLDGLLFPKADGPNDVRHLDVLIREQEMHKALRPGNIVMIPMIESARAVLRCLEIAQASTRIAALALGGEDYAADLGVPRTAAANELEYARRILVHVAVANRLQPLDGIYAMLHDDTGLAADAAYARSIGMKGKYVIHPEQVEPVNRAFSPSAGEIEAARRIVQAYDEAMGRGLGVIDVDGQMVDVPVANRARDLLALAEAIGL
jgi:citrate lyase subunit beta/citryl-CoA lyase